MDERDFIEVQADIITQMWACLRCGVVVTDRDKHDAVHETLDL